MLEEKLDVGKMKINKRILALILSGNLTFTLVGCKYNGINKIRIGAVSKDDDLSFVSGAHIVVKDDKNHIIEGWITDENYYVIPNLKTGNYTASLVHLPQDYYYDDSLDRDISFEVTSKSYNITIEFELQKIPDKENSFDDNHDNFVRKLSIKY